jgi:hypothetical protein
MKRINTPAVAARPEKRLVLQRETLRRLGAEELQHIVGGTLYLTCSCTNPKAATPPSGDEI